MLQRINTINLAPFHNLSRASIFEDVTIEDVKLSDFLDTLRYHSSLNLEPQEWKSFIDSFLLDYSQTRIGIIYYYLKAIDYNQDNFIMAYLFNYFHSTLVLEEGKEKYREVYKVFFEKSADLCIDKVVDDLKKSKQNFGETAIFYHLLATKYYEELNDKFNNNNYSQHNIIQAVNNEIPTKFLNSKKITKVKKIKNKIFSLVNEDHEINAIMQKHLVVGKLQEDNLDHLIMAANLLAIKQYCTTILCNKEQTPREKQIKFVGYLTSLCNQFNYIKSCISSNAEEELRLNFLNTCYKMQKFYQLVEHYILQKLAKNKGEIFSNIRLLLKLGSMYVHNNFYYNLKVSEENVNNLIISLGNLLDLIKQYDNYNKNYYLLFYEQEKEGNIKPLANVITNVMKITMLNLKYQHALIKGNLEIFSTDRSNMSN